MLVLARKQMADILLLVSKGDKLVQQRMAKASTTVTQMVKVNSTEAALTRTLIET